MRQAVLGYEQQFYLNGTQISGVQSVEGSYSISEKPINVLGWGHVNKAFYEQAEYFQINEQGLLIDSDGFRLLQEKICTRERNEKLPESLAVLNAPLEGSFSINSILVSEDFMLNFTGDNPFTGSIHHGNSYFGFHSGYITSHSVSCGIGQLPVTNTNIRVLGDIGGSPDIIENEDDTGLKSEENFLFIQEKSENPTTYNASGELPFPEIKLANQESIQVEIGGLLPEHEGINYADEPEDDTSDYVFDRVTSFNHTINIGVDPIYTVGSTVPAQVDVVWPIASKTDFTVEVDERKYKSLRKYLKSPTLHNLAIRIKDCFGEPIQNYTVKLARLTNESMSASTNGRLTANLSYTAYYNKR